MGLRSNLLKLAFDHSELRKDLIPLLKNSARRNTQEEAEFLAKKWMNKGQHKFKALVLKKIGVALDALFLAELTEDPQVALMEVKEVSRFANQGWAEASLPEGVPEGDVLYNAKHYAEMSLISLSLRKNIKDSIHHMETLKQLIQKFMR